MVQKPIQADMMVNLFGIRVDSRFIAPVLITIILLVGQINFGFLENYEFTGLAIATSIVLELVIGRIVYGKWLNVASAYVSGISVGILVRSPHLWPYILCASLAILSKYVFRVNGRHIWNPSNFAISVMIITAPQVVSTLTTQWGNSLAPVALIWILGSVIVWRLHRFHICAAYIAANLVFAFGRSLLPGHLFSVEVAPITGAMYQLFIFFMITDPKSTVKSRNGQIAVAVAVAFVESLFRLDNNTHAPYFALFAVGPVANLIDIWMAKRKTFRIGLANRVAST